jgi:hypothetical protein
MNRYTVTYFYLATGMEGIPDIVDHGIVEANSPEEAKDIVALREFPEDIMYGPNNTYSTRGWFRTALTAKLITNDRT